MTTPKPLLIYDGDCGFCQYWVDYWHQLTGNEVSYKPYQEVAEQFPSIPVEEFQKAVQYVAKDGTISRAAKASFLTLSHAKGRGFWLALYRFLPGFSFVSEKAYVLVASHRSFFYAICLFLWGRTLEIPRYDVLAWLFVRAFALVFLIAFISFGMQAQGLIGSQGIAPVSNLVEAGHRLLDTERYWQIPMLFWLNTSDVFIQIVCWSGTAFSLLLFFNQWPRACLLSVYALYLSLIYAGQMFMTFQWDSYLLETAIICFFMLGSLTIGIWLLRWLLFRFIFVGGMVKLLSGDPAWQNATALIYYFNTEPLPTPLAWYANQLSPVVLKAGAMGTLLVELFVPFFIFLPRRLRFFAASVMIFFQTVILITGNYNWFNILTILLCFILFDDAAIRCFFPSRFFQSFTSNTSANAKRRLFFWVAILFALFSVSFSLLQLQLRFGGKASPAIASLYNKIAPFSLVNIYGPFAVITKERMEIVLEGSNDGIDWKEYAFKYKPGDIKRRPPWNIPLQPRLDWQMWFAALGSPEQSPWFYQFMQRLLENAPPVVALLETNPFPDKPPKYLRALFYEYTFTTQEEWRKTGAWWTRGLVGYYVREQSLTLIH